MYKQRTSPSYYPNIVPIQMGRHLTNVNYSDMVDESCLAFSHVHDDYEIYYCMEGSVQLVIDDRCETLTKNCFAMVNPETYHHPLYDPQTAKKVFLFVFEPFQMNAIKNKEMVKCGVSELVEKSLDFLQPGTGILFEDKFGCDKIVDRLAREIELCMPGYDQMIRSLYTEFMVNIFRNFNVMNGEAEATADRDAGNVNIAMELTYYMHNHYSEDIKVKDAAEYFHISERQLSRVFEAYFGKSFKNTLNIYRINYAKNYLIDTNLSLEKIAEQVGISSAKMFHRLFKEKENMTPTEFREKHRH